MGWWGHDILDGDTPLDCKGEICEDILGMSEGYYDLSAEEFAESFRKQFNMVTKRKKLLVAVNKCAKITHNSDADDARVFCEVAALLVIESGHVHDETPKIIHAGRVAASREREFCHEEGWSNPTERYGHLTAFIELCDKFMGFETEEQIEALDSSDEDVVTVTFLVNKCHHVEGRPQSLIAELRRVQENSEVGLTLRSALLNGKDID